MESTVLTTYELNQLIGKKVGENEEFRLALLNDPIAALEKEFAVKFPENIKVELHVESSNVLHLIIPAANTDELTDDQLVDVAGGMINPGSMVVAYGITPGIWNWPKW
ncbi:NHLP leader peptide family RiPP precursor [Desulfotomaculum sp. 1211_IL3151]|uniref:NHLP leader peptide family RiPP precursor n=1 Tax=Desulfotomaculum sp. 1211_IL3151 TaxID=3084055 RepID=UPI002FDA8428